MFFTYNQNNSGGRYEIDPKSGIDVVVYIEANNYEEANNIAEDMGIYFDGVEQDIDCECCGDRWYRALNDDGEDAKIFFEKLPRRNKDKKGYIKFLDGKLLKVSELTNELIEDIVAKCS